jgi:hypothetical protein
MVCTAGITFSPDIPADVDKLFSDSKGRAARVRWNRQKQSRKKEKRRIIFTAKEKRVFARNR